MKEKNWIKILFSFASLCRKRIILSVFCAVISVGGGILPYFGVYKIIALFIEETPRVDRLLFWAALCIIGYFVQVLFHGISTTLAHISAYTILESMRLKIANKLMSAPLGIVLNNTIGNLKNIIVDRVESIEVPLAHVIPEVTSNLLLPIGVFIYLCLIDWRMALATIVTVPMAGVIFAIMMKNFNKQYDDYVKANNHINSVIVEYVEGIEVIKAFNQSTTSYEKFTNGVTYFKDYTLRWFNSTWALMNLAFAVLPSTLIGTLPVGIALYIGESLTTSEFTICLILSAGIVTPLLKVTMFINEAKSMQYAINDIDKLLNMIELETTKKPINITNYDIRIQDVSFSYELKDKNKKNMALSGVNLYMKQGSFSALVGPSGGGKSTVARLIARFWDVDEGSIQIGGVDIKRIPIGQLADIVTFVTQDNFLFNCSIKENIRLGNPEASDDEVYRAARAACCDEFIQGLKDGYNTKVGESGNQLSGGEKQRIAIARAILKNAPIVILDEATAFTDPENEDKIQESIRVLTKGKTLLVIAHRLSTVKNADQIIVLEMGQVIQVGAQKQLLESCPLFTQMWNAHIGAKTWSVSNRKGKEQKVNV